MKSEALQLLPTCPRCGSDALNNYGHTKNGKQRFICLVCSRQFIEGTMLNYRNRPLCPRCHSAMHVYMNKPTVIRFRCSKYPHCRGYFKVIKEKLSQ